MGGVVSGMYGWIFSSGQSGPNEKLGPDADVPDKATGLTPRQKMSIRYTWSFVRLDLKTHGIAFFCLLFKTHPKLQDHFKSLKGMSQKELRSSHRLAAHGYTVMQSITGLVDNLEDPSCLVELLKKLGHNHQERDVPKSDLELLIPVIIQYLREQLPNIWSPDVENAWSKAMRVITDVMMGAYD